MWPLIGIHFLTMVKVKFLSQAANDSDLEPVAYEFFTQAFMLYEEEVAVIANKLFPCSSTYFDKNYSQEATVIGLFFLHT